MTQLAAVMLRPRPRPSSVTNGDAVASLAFDLHGDRPLMWLYVVYRSLPLEALVPADGAVTRGPDQYPTFSPPSCC